jgi:hypothetical protein
VAIENPKVVDFIGVECLTGCVVLTIADHWDWRSEGEHILALQEKVNTYLAFIESGELIEQYPDAAERRVVIEIDMKYPPPAMATEFLRRAAETVRAANLELRSVVLATEQGLDADGS